MPDLTYWPLREALPSSVKDAYRRDYSKGSGDTSSTPPMFSDSPVSVQGEYGSAPSGSPTMMNQPYGRMMYHKDIGF